MKILLTLIISILLSGILAAQRIKFATLAPEGTTYLNIMKELDDDIRKATGNQVSFKIYPGGIQGDEKDVVRKIRLGQLHSAGFTGVGLGEIMPELRILELPMLFRSYEEVDFITGQLYDRFARKFEENGYIILGWADIGFAYIYGQKPITSLSQLRSTKVWMWEGDPVAEATFAALDVKAIPMALTNVLTSLQTGLLEAVYSPALPCVSLQWHTRINTVMDLPLANVSGAVLISKKMFDKLAPEHQMLLQEKGKHYMAKLIAQGREDNAKSLQLMQENGIQLVKVPEASAAEFYKATKRAHLKLVGQLYDRALLDQIEASLAKFRKK